MENNSLIKSSQDIEAIRKMSNEELAKYAENKAKEILALIQQSCNKVKNANKEAEVAKAMKIRFWQRSKRLFCYASQEKPNFIRKFNRFS